MIVNHVGVIAVTTGAANRRRGVNDTMVLRRRLGLEAGVARRAAPTTLLLMLLLNLPMRVTRRVAVHANQRANMFA